MAALRRLRRKAPAESPRVVYRPVRGVQTYAEDWADASGVKE